MTTGAATRALIKLGWITIRLTDSMTDDEMVGGGSLRPRRPFAHWDPVLTGST